MYAYVHIHPAELVLPAYMCMFICICVYIHPAELVLPAYMCMFICICVHIRPVELVLPAPRIDEVNACHDYT